MEARFAFFLIPGLGSLHGVGGNFGFGILVAIKVWGGIFTGWRMVSAV